MKTVEPIRSVGEEGRVAEIAFGHFSFAAGEERGIDMELEVEPKLKRGLRVTDRVQDRHESLGGGELRRVGLVAEPVAARLVGHVVREANASAYGFDGAEHLVGLLPCAVEENDRSGRLRSRCRRGEGITTGVKDPAFLVVFEPSRLKPCSRYRPVRPLVQMDRAFWDGPGNEPAGARRLLVLVAVDEQVDGESSLDR
jgi:hypothetical protein